jgi:4'-phosphopantetheinyl transferase EntD
VPILKGDKGEPCWPDGVVGSLTHCTGYRGAVVGRRDAVRSVGIDAEPHDVLPKGVLDAISLLAERTEIPRALPGELHWDRILFCAKEATYKAWFPLTKRWLGFEDAHITFLADSESAGRFVSRILIDPAAVSGPPLTSLAGRWSVERGLVLTAIVL